MQRVGVQVFADFVHGVVRGHQLAAVGKINAVNARIHVRRTTHGDVDFARAGFLQSFHTRLARRPAHDGIVNDDNAFALHERLDEIQFHAHIEIADELRRLEKTASDVMVADERHLVRNAGFLGVTHRGTNAAVGHRNDEVGFDVVLARELATHFLPHVVNAVSVDDAVGTREINVFKNAERALLMLRPGLNAGDTFFVDDDDFARLNIADELRVNQIQRGRFARQNVSAVRRAAN